MAAARDASEQKSFDDHVRSCKKRHRPRLKDWSKDGFASRRASDFDALATADVFGTEEISREPHTLSQADFAEKYERTSTPLVVRGCVEHEAWPARTRWRSYGELLKTAGAADLRLKCGEDDDGRTIKMRLDDFARYASSNADDSPLYIFDQGFSDRKGAQICLDAFKVPNFVKGHDLFQLVGEDRRPPYRWWLLGPKRSGTCAHVDPLGTSAWNTVVSGRKRWVLFEPGTSKVVAKGSKLCADWEDDEACNYFVDILPRIRKHHAHARRVEFIQEPGETVYVPGGWWHAVINLDDTVGVTQNFASAENFDAVWEQTRTGRRGMAHKWLRALEASPLAAHKALAERAKLRPPIHAEAAPKDVPEGRKRARPNDEPLAAKTAPSFRRDKSPDRPRDFGERRTARVSDDDDAPSP
ncbi:hypothetical protein M885DRAFT_522319 [Pelagophyceae sp. CCMP2097]|nr:hypothetical protein M885DRAFT_522319 [Pelagophyceae sp. CCMP2097]|mmetsp:Transcript_3886/g.11938  ORF Transcript_3886/g.11938 Transcript_3886/m.11938 type:complete len:413 (-) Transcript_3886:122-1360(-)